jgi:ABC-type phosphate transport system substrate-binding protein
MPAAIVLATSPARHLLGVAVAAALLALAPIRLSAQIAVVVNAANAVDDISTDALRRIYLGQSTTLPNGKRARLATHAGSSERFDRDALKLHPETVRSRWMAMTFRGEATSIPTDFSSTDEVKRFVREHPDAIAYLPLADVDGTVKVLRIDGRRPSDAGYLLR